MARGSGKGPGDRGGRIRGQGVFFVCWSGYGVFIILCGSIWVVELEWWTECVTAHAVFLASF